MLRTRWNRWLALGIHRRQARNPPLDVDILPH
jgi:hypothetical protein